MKNPAAALGLVLFAVYFLTASGHTYSPDEESLLYVTRSFVTRGEFDIPNPERYPVTGGHRGDNGEIFSGTGLAQSMIALPLCVVGDEIARAFDSHFHDLLLRLVVVSLFNALISALTGMLLYAWLRRLHVSARASTALVLIWAFATMAWVYARTFYSEPLLTFCFVLTGYAIATYHDAHALRWMAIAGLAAGLGILTKVQGVLVLPALGVYLIALEAPWWWGRGVEFNAPTLHLSYLLLPGLVFAGALGVGAALTGYFDFIRFGDLLQTGRGEISQGFPILIGLSGLLLSSGKSIFLYAPPILLFFFALPRVLRQYAAEALLCVVFIATFVTFHARLEIWSGDGAWGPRYLVSTLPFWLLPVGALLGDWWRNRAQRTLVVALVAAGLLVNGLGLAMNWDTYIQLQPNANARYFVPAASPLVWQWKLLTERVNAWWSDVIAAQNAVVPVRGLLATGDGSIFPRYIAPRATLLLKSNLDQPLEMSLMADDYRPDNQAKRRLVFFANGIALQAQLLPTGDSGLLNYRVEIPASLTRWAALDIVTSGSAPVGTSPMGDELGLQVQSLEVAAEQQTLTMPQYLAIPPLPTGDPKAMWAWFYEPGNAQLDFFWWYLFFSGLGDAQVLAISAFVLAGGILCLALGLPPVVRTARRN